MRRLIPNVQHLRLEQSHHSLPRGRVARFCPKIEQFHWVLIAVKQFPFLLFPAAMSVGKVETLIVPEDELVSFISDTVVGLQKSGWHALSSPQYSVEEGLT